MKTKLTLLFTLVLAGCVPSWNAFYADKDVTFDRSLLGEWRPVEAKESSKETWTFSQAGDGVYQLVQTDEEGRKAEFEVRLFQLRQHLFLDLYLTKLRDDELKVNAWAGISLVPAHLLLKVEQKPPALKLAAMNPDWLRKFLKGHPDAIAHRKVGDGDIVLSATTTELQRFILEHVKDEEFFGGAMEFKRP